MQTQATKLERAEIDKQLEQFEAWMLDDESGKLVAGFEFETFDEAVDFVDQIAEIAANVNHHPDILLHDVKFVTLFTSTHDAEGVTEKDFELVRAIEDEVKQA